MNIRNLSLLFVLHTLFFTIEGSFEFINHFPFDLVINNLSKAVNEAVKSTKVTWLDKNEFSFCFFISCIALKFINCLVVIDWLSNSNSVVQVVKLMESCHDVAMSRTINPL